MRLTRILLARTLAEKAKAARLPELESVERNTGASENILTVTRKIKVRDYDKIVDKITARIQSLDLTRKFLMSGERSGKDEVIGFEVVVY